MEKSEKSICKPWHGFVVNSAKHFIHHKTSQTMKFKMLLETLLNSHPDEFINQVLTGSLNNPSY